MTVKESHANLTVGDWFRLRTEPGQVFKFLGHVTKGSAEWVDAWGGDKNPDARRSYRSFHVTENFIPTKNPQRGAHAK